MKQTLIKMGIWSGLTFLGLNYFTPDVRTDAYFDCVKSEGILSYSYNGQTVSVCNARTFSGDSRYSSSVYFYRQMYGSMTTYTPVAPFGKQYQTSLNSLYSLFENVNWGGDKFRNYSVPLNTTYCAADATGDASCISGGHTTERMGSDSNYVPEGTSGEFRFIGYTHEGVAVDNTYFPADYQFPDSSSKYPWDYQPWNKGYSYDRTVATTTEWDPLWQYSSDGTNWSIPTSMPRNNYVLKETAYDETDNPAKSRVKQEAIARLIAQESDFESKSVSYWMNHLSLRNDARIESGVFVGTQSSEGYKREVTVEYDSLRLGEAFPLDKALSIWKRDGVALWRDCKTWEGDLCREVEGEFATYGPTETIYVTNFRYNVLLLETPAVSKRNIYLSEMRLIEVDNNNRVIATAKREALQGVPDVWTISDFVLDPGTNYRIEVDIANGSEETVQNNNGSVCFLWDRDRSNQNASYTSESYTYKQQEVQSVKDSIASGTSVTRSKDFTIEQAFSTVGLIQSFRTELGDCSGNTFETWADDNQFTQDDKLEIQMKTDKDPEGDTVANYIALNRIQPNGQATQIEKTIPGVSTYNTEIIQGAQYAFTFGSYYVGGRMPSADTFAYKANATIYQLEPTLVNGVATWKETKLELKNIPTTPNAVISLYGNTLYDVKVDFLFDTNVVNRGTFLASSNQLKVIMEVVAPEYSWNQSSSMSGKKYNLDSNTNNNTLSATFTRPTNISLEYISLDPSKFPGPSACGSELNLVANYGVYFTTALENNQTVLGEDRRENIKVSYLVQAVNSSGGTRNLYTAEETIVIQANKHTDHSKSIIISDNSTCVNEGESVKVYIKVNSDELYHEVLEGGGDAYVDNKKHADWTSNNEMKGYCENTANVNEINTWRQQYVFVDSVDGEYFDGDSSSLGNLDIDKVHEEYRTTRLNKEQYRITKIEMRSKLMDDLGWGDAGNGWVVVYEADIDGNVLSTKKPVIKAGYGYEIRTTVQYQTDAFENERELEETWKLTNADMNRELYRKLERQPLSSDLYIQSPNNGISLSAMGKYSSNQGLTQTVTQNSEEHMIWDYEITPHASSNGTGNIVQTVSISENTPDGDYTFTFYTHPLTGVHGKSEVYYDAAGMQHANSFRILCDRVEIDFTVNGSAYDDLNTHIIN